MSRTQWNYDSVKSYYSEQNCLLLSKSYRNNREKLDYVCSYGRTHQSSFKKFAFGQRCPNCAGNEKLNSDQVARYFIDQHCQLIDPYQSYHAKLNYICSCGNQSTISFAKFKSGQRCKQCQEQRKQQQWIEQYGVSNPMQVEAIKQKQHETNLEKYGVKHPLLNNKIKQKANKTILEKYGVTHCSQLLQPYPKESQKLFWLLYTNLQSDDQKHTYFAELNKEFESQQPYFKYDFVVSSLKRCIEYNGSKWHPKPELSDSDTGWHIFKPMLKAREQRDYENLKYKQLIDRSYQVLVVWDYEFKSKPQETIQHCIQFLYS